MLPEIIFNELLPDVESLTAQVDAVLNEDLYWFPVRHHSAAVARHVGQAIRQRRPKVVFIGDRLRRRS